MTATLLYIAEQASHQLEQENSDAVAKIKQDEVNNALAITAAGLNAAKGLSDAFFAGQMNKAKGNAAAELALKHSL